MFVSSLRETGVIGEAPSLLVLALSIEWWHRRRRVGAQGSVVRFGLVRKDANSQNAENGGFIGFQPMPNAHDSSRFACMRYPR
jgi:hypothetical protein